MGAVLTTLIHVKDWQVLGILIDQRLVGQARDLGATRFHLYRNLHDASEALLVAEFRDHESATEFGDALSDAFGRTGEGDVDNGRLWELMPLSRIG